MEEKKRYNLGVLIGGVHTYFPKEHIKGISEAASELDVNVCFFLGTRTKDFFEDVLGSKQKNSYDYQFNTIHDYSLIGGLDGLIINYGTLGIQLREVDPNEFARKYNGITTVFLTEVVDVPNCHSLICDNKGGIAMVISHLVEEHHPIAAVEDVFNAVMVRGNAVGEVMFYGPGAGKLPTASAVVADVIDAAQHRQQRRRIGWKAGGKEVCGGVAALSMRCYLRTKDDLGRVEALFPDCEILSSQKGEVAFITPKMPLETLRQCAEALQVCAKLCVLE